MPKITGGGIQSRIVKKVGVRTGPASSNKISPRGASQYGYATGSRLKALRRTTARFQSMQEQCPRFRWVTPSPLT